MTEKEGKLRNSKESIERLFEEKYEYVQFKNRHLKGEKLFVSKNGYAFHIDKITEYNCLVIEHSDSVEEAEKLMLEDGDLFYLDNYADDNELFAAMLNEVILSDND